MRGGGSAAAAEFPAPILITTGPRRPVHRGNYCKREAVHAASAGLLRTGGPPACMSEVGDWFVAGDAQLRCCRARPGKGHGAECPRRQPGQPLCSPGSQLGGGAFPTFATRYSAFSRRLLIALVPAGSLYEMTLKVKEKKIGEPSCGTFGAYQRAS